MSRRLPEPVRTVAATRIDGGQSSRRDDRVAGEEAVALVYNGVTHAVMLATPADLEDFALGFSLSEGIIDSPADFDLVEVRAGDDGISVQVAIPGRCFDRLEQRRRALPGNSGCGLCGSESLAEVLRMPTTAQAAPVSPSPISAAMAQLYAAQPMNAQCHGLHAVGLANADGGLVCVREDVGRHNALDKLIGAMAREGVQPGGRFIVATSRASFEMVRKTAAAGIGLLATISAPTSLAVRMAGQAGLALVAFARGEAMSVYAGRLPD
ncbi:formate dehydrogenase accessory sulfurtransferase FdhD [Pseudofulvimonas gallinarii]|uniref:Sulfur carrier protein FdhD n=1 Tax=Pseudofulvimonas gallinarii TaxID=634155 RepID=A0A4R3L4R9_9GAMM|nr:formate dehydrogenase accessory sulfurtransferase FdhD [Pseudofulvimonas gallinarii]TCS94342.1 FdhD protein [Pseudofulvimonas gallinarii]THD14672.1 hypothetical protein B1808_02565 [Pseudofulvimonas gallinarii]